MKHIQTSRGSLHSLCGKDVLFCDTATHFDADCQECQTIYRQRRIYKMSDYMKEMLPDVDFETIKNVVKNYRSFQSNIHGRFCDVCMKQLTDEERQMMSPMDFMACCLEHRGYAQHFQVEKVREKLGIKVEDLPFYE